MAAAVLIECPDTGQLVPTGMRANAMDELPAVSCLQACVACGGDHEWSTAEAVVTAISDGWAPV
jgi:hypothetical protein